LPDDLSPESAAPTRTSLVRDEEAAPAVGVPNALQPTAMAEKATDLEFTIEFRSRSQMIFRRFLRHRLAVGSFVLFLFILLLSVIGGHVWTYSYTQLTNSLGQGPSLSHPFGTDDIGHDLFAQVLHGSETSIQIALVIALVGTAIGTTIGSLAGFYGGWADSVLMRFTDLILVVPVLAILLVIAHNVAKAAGSWFWISVIISAVIWTYVARLVRSSFLSLREREFVEAARAIGASDARIILRHLLPNAVGPIIVNATLTVATAVLLESALSFLGLGVQPPDTSLGLLIAQGQASAFTEPWLFIFPAVFLVVLVLCVNFIGDGLRDAFDPAQNRVRA
jgi:ABC-type dipeptide/oligopeptide/nickel transport system permease subunit